MIDLTMHEERLQHAIDRAKERNILIPTFAQMQNPALIPENVKKALKSVGLWDVNQDMFDGAPLVNARF